MSRYMSGLTEALKLKLKDRLFDLISTKGRETFAEIQNHNIEGVRGEYVFTWENRPDLVLWPCLSKEAIAAFTGRKEDFPPPGKPADLCLRRQDGGPPDR